jgi:hypothetical protein
MKKRKFQLNSTLRSVLLILLLSVAGMTKGFALPNYDIEAICPSGQTLYYNITDTNNHYVMLTFPSYIAAGGYYDGFSKPTGNIILPSTLIYNGITYTVTKIGDYAFYGCSGLTGSLTIPSSVTSIGELAFADCSGFTGSLTIPSSVTTIGGGSFTDCSGFTGSLTIPNSVTSIEWGTFSGCSGLTGSLTIPDSVTTIGNSAFSGCSGLTGSLTIPDSVTTIGSSAFYGCSGFTGSLTIQSSVELIAPNAFSGCSGFTGSLTIPNSVTWIGDEAFYGCSGFTGSLTIQSSVTSISEEAFSGCTGFTSLIVQAEAPPESSYCYDDDYDGICDPFYGWDKSILVSVPCGSVSSYQSAQYWNLFTNYQGIDCVEYNITASANPVEGGVVVGDDTYNQGQTCTLSATPNANYIFLNWTENGEVVSTNAEYSFTVAGDRDLVANFDALTNYWEPESNDFEDNMTLTCIVQLDGVEQATSMLEVGAFCGTQCRGSQRATYFAPSDHYIIQMIVFGESNDMISFRLYDHLTEQELMLTPPTPITFNSNGYGSLFNPYVLNFTSNVLISAEASPVGAGTITGVGEYPIGTEVTLAAVANMGYQFVNWMLDGEVVSTSPSYQFTVTEAADFVANFGCVHTQALNSGWNWWSTYIELTDNNGLSQLENSLGNAGILIKSRTNGYVEAYQYNGATNWYGTLTSINNEQMYKVRTNANCNAIVSGSFALPESHPITIKNGWNWIGFPCNQNVSVDVALSGFTPEANDVIKGRNGFTTYYSDENYSIWYGTLNTLEPGRGYMYRSNSTTQKTLVFQTGRGEMTVENVMTENNIFQPADGDFADNMTITAVLELDGEELRSEDYEIAAFVGDECRGSVKLMYVEPVNRFVAFLTVFGEPSETLYFRLTDGTQTELSMDEITFAADGMEGTLSEPMTLRFGTTKLDENEWSKVLVYPNPSNGVFNIQGQGIRKVEVFNAFGQAVVSEETSNDHLQIDLSRYADGCYMLRVVTDNGIINRQLIKK